jgi:enterochelin esterase-like enzyme
MQNPTIKNNTAIIIWNGANPPHLISDLHGWEENPQAFKKVGKGWEISLELEADAYLEYAFYYPDTKKRTPDPLNKASVYNGVGGHNHFFYMPGASPTPLTKLPAGGLRGNLTRHTVDGTFLTTSNTRRIYLYHPPTTEAVPLLAVYDGLDYFRRGKLTEIVDNLIAAKRIRPIGLAFLQNAGKARMVEYGCAETTLAFLMKEVLPLAGREMKLLDYEKTPGVHGIMGASMGGLMSVYTALRLPGVFGHALSQAGAFVLWEHESAAMLLAGHLPPTDVKLWLDCGKLDFLLDANRQMHTLLREKGYNVTYRENGGAHNYTTWRDACVEGLETLFA